MSQRSCGRSAKPLVRWHWGRSAEVISPSASLLQAMLYVGSTDRVVEIPMDMCRVYRNNCDSCLLARDPYCGWLNGTCQSVYLNRYVAPTACAISITFSWLLSPEKYPEPQCSPSWLGPGLEAIFPSQREMSLLCPGGDSTGVCAVPKNCASAGIRPSHSTCGLRRKGSAGFEHPAPLSPSEMRVALLIVSLFPAVDCDELLGLTFVFHRSPKRECGGWFFPTWIIAGISTFFLI